MAYRVIPDETVAAMQARRDEGVAIRAIAAEFDVHESTVASRTKPSDKATTPGRGRGATAGAHHAADAQTAQMWQMWCRGITQQKIAEKFGLTQPAVSNRINRYAASLPQTARETVFQRELDVLDDIRRSILGIMLSPNHDASDRLGAARTMLTSMERLARMLGLDSADALAERQVQLAEEQGQLVATAIGRILVALGLDPADNGVRAVVHRELAVIAGEAG